MEVDPRYTLSDHLGSCLQEGNPTLSCWLSRGLEWDSPTEQLRSPDQAQRPVWSTLPEIKGFTQESLHSFSHVSDEIV